MENAMPIVQARNKLTGLPEAFERDPGSGAIAVTRRGKPVLAIMPWDLYEAITETLEIAGDPELMASLRQGIEEATNGEGISWEEAKKALER